MATLDDDLGSKLPRGVLSDLGGWTLYQSFRTFTWPWLLRRGVVFWPLALLAGSAFAAWHASGMGAWSDWLPLAARACLATLLTVSTGPALATLVRHLHPPEIVERALVVVAIAVGLWVGLVALRWAGEFHDHLMAGYSNRPMQVSVFGQAMSRFFRASIDASVFVWIFAGGGLATIYYFGERRRIAQYAARRQVESLRAERDAADMRLAVLQAQVEPHFLFNTLASVRSLIAGEPERAAQTIDALAGYLRATLPRFREAGPAEATLDRQIDLCRGYLELMRVRMAGRLTVRVEADAAMRALPFPPLLLLTLVENAVTHGVEPKPGPGEIAIVARVEGETLSVSVEDDGAGLAEGVTPGVGLANVRAQLASLFGDRATLDVASRSEGGVRARIRVPLGGA
ncbi:histidine kinase [Caulobacter sp. 1776]|uniref:sensor histidine kinase n=1 Tax=Caulobacter sp. 1776 TaxID=3156420 RepID=UPI00339643FE